MSVADLRQSSDPARVPSGGPVGAVVYRPHAVSSRFFRSELLLIFGRRRNWVGGLILATVPILIAIAVKVSPPSPGGGGMNFLNQITQNGIFVALSALTLEMPLFLPLAVAAIAGDTVAGEAHLGTLRYLLTVPVDRTRLLVVKFGAIAVFALVATLLVALVGAMLGLALFGGGPVVTLSGTTLPFWTGAARLLLVIAYITMCMTALGAIGLFVSTLTEQPIGATIAILVLALGSEIMDAIPQLSVIHEYLPTHYWAAFGDLLRDPISTAAVVPGIWSALAYTAIFGAAAWARFGGRDVTS
ncbi:ABC transporter permease [Rugosimonospora africana]|uniref:ABC transporter permease n=1 Tax=Rugosimonospora africana TaxID=556532 RepID=A0A8J3VUU0_9ACTN|nr:ABC transporter permease [Rugosimonospora africana]GIH19091.1 ABC transporter permease [Rugosimonospora africana]